MTLSLAPFVPSHPEVVQRMLQISNVTSQDVVCDLGCGDGRIPLSAVNDFDARKAIGYEVRKDLFQQALEEVANQNLQNQIILINLDLMKADISEATVITLYLTTSGNKHLKPKLFNEAKQGTRVISHDFQIQGWHPTYKENFQGHTIYLYLIPDAFQQN
jgi:16S rRNA A1518/A1519 N6-dimethyltransferase RsmA/KsgA/DIM1 with predicted DNA glycosylase/AP lyase activity